MLRRQTNITKEKKAQGGKKDSDQGGCVRTSARRLHTGSTIYIAGKYCPSKKKQQTVAHVQPIIPTSIKHV